MLYSQRQNPFNQAGVDAQKCVPTGLSGISFNVRSYAVWTVPAVCQTRKPDSPAAAWYFFIFFTKMLHCVQHFCEKDGIFRPAGGGILSDQEPRNSCQCVRLSQLQPQQSLYDLLTGELAHAALEDAAACGALDNGSGVLCRIVLPRQAFTG
jgi:hypothetical protein